MVFRGMNKLAIAEGERKFHWPAGPRLVEHPFRAVPERQQARVPASRQGYEESHEPGEAEAGDPGRADHRCFAQCIRMAAA
jgi:hypothetical protein